LNRLTVLEDKDEQAFLYIVEDNFVLFMELILKRWEL
jgi:hypothetical protein